MSSTNRHLRPSAPAQATTPWELHPLSDGVSLATAKRLTPRNGLHAAQERQSGYEEGRAQGYADAAAEVRRAAQQARAADLQRLEAILVRMQSRFDELTAQGADALLDLAIEIAAQVLRREVRTQRDAILPVVREALALVTESHGHPTVRLSPADIAFVRDALSEDGHLRGARFVEDPTVEPGGCRVDTSQVEIDATIGTRWRRTLEALGCEPDGNAALRDPHDPKEAP